MVLPSAESVSRPTFKEHFQVEVIEPKTVYLLSEKQHFVLKGRLYCLLAPLLNGCHTIDAIVEHLKGQATAEEIDYALKRLTNSGYITEANGILPEVSAFWQLLDVDPTTAVQRLQSTTVSVTAIGTVSAKPLNAQLTDLGVNVSSTGDVSVVLTDDYLQPDLEQINHEALRLRRSWLLAKPIGGVVWIGPIFCPGKTGCWECLAQRLRANREIESFIQNQGGDRSPIVVSRAALPSTQQTGFSLIATELAKWLVGASPALESQIITANLVNLELQQHVLVRRPQCPCCGDDRSNQDPQPVLLHSQPKQGTGEGGYRRFSPDETLQQYHHHISPITGVVRALVRPAVGDPDLIHTYVADHSLPRLGNTLDDLHQAVQPKSFGKGKTDIQAKVSGLGEAIERYCSGYTGSEHRIWATYVDLGKAAIHPAALMQYSEAQYRTRHTWNQLHHSVQHVPDPFDETQAIDWSPAWSLTAQTISYVPTAYCYYGYPVSDDHSFCWADTNGNAAGTTREDAILQGFMELVERDAVAIWWYNRLTRPALDLSSFNDPYLHALQSYYRSLHREFWVLDISGDLTIPTFAAISRYIEQQPEDILFGFGAHSDPHIALVRAITEMNQMVFLSSASGRHASAKFTRHDIQNWCATATLKNHPYLAPDPSAVPKKYADYPQWSNADLREDILRCVAIAQQHGLETLVLDQTRPDVSMPVVKVLVPGLRHFWARFAPGRLYDVPVKQGWLARPLTEEQLNPIPMFL